MIATLRGLREDVSRLSRDVETLRSEVHKKSHKVKFDLGNVSHLFYHSGEFVDCIESIIVLICIVIQWWSTKNISCLYTAFKRQRKASC